MSGSSKVESTKQRIVVSKSSPDAFLVASKFVNFAIYPCFPLGESFISFMTALWHSPVDALGATYMPAVYSRNIADNNSPESLHALNASSDAS